MRLGKKDVARLLEGFPVPSLVCPWALAPRYEIVNGVIRPDDQHPDDLQNEFEDYDAFGDPDLFFSFARLGARGEPSESSILRWVAEHGQLRQECEGHPELARTAINQQSITVEDFRSEVLCAYQLLTLYTDIREENLAALQSSMHDLDNKRHPLSDWPHTPPTDLEKHVAYYRDARNGGREQPLVRLKDEIRDPNERGRSSVEHWDTYVAVTALRTIMRNRLAKVRLDFDQFWTESSALENAYKIPSSWYCPDLLSVMYLQFYLLITDFEPMRHCENPACGLPFPATRKNRRFCNATCRSNARNYR